MVEKIIAESPGITWKTYFPFVELNENCPGTFLVVSPIRIVFRGFWKYSAFSVDIT